MWRCCSRHTCNRAEPKDHIEMTIPNGWKLVPVKPTEEMIHAAALYRQESEGLQRPMLTSKLYAAMLDAAPRPCTQQDVEDAMANPPLSGRVEP
jgi:hypothetical protein